MATPRWKQMFDVVEKQAGPLLGRVVSNPDVVEALTIGVAVQKRASEDLANVVRRGLHLVNVPAGTDVQKVSQQIASLEREVRTLNRRIADLTSDDLTSDDLTSDDLTSDEEDE